MQTQPPTPDRMGITGRIAQLHESYRNAFHAEFDPAAFRADDFYAFQVLEKAITKGTPTLRDAAQEMQDLRLAGIEEAEPETDPDAETDTETPDMLATSELIQSSEPLDAPEADEPLLPESFLAAPHEAAPQPAGPDLPESILEPSEAQLIAAQAHAHAAAISAARMHTALAAARAKALARAAALETGGTPEGAAPEGEGPEGGATAPGAPAAAAALDAAPAAPDTLGAGGAAVPTLPGTDPVMGADPDLLLTADAADAMPQLPGQERRAAAARGHVRLGSRRSCCSRRCACNTARCSAAFSRSSISPATTCTRARCSRCAWNRAIPNCPRWRSSSSTRRASRAFTAARARRTWTLTERRLSSN